MVNDEAQDHAQNANNFIAGLSSPDRASAGSDTAGDTDYSDADPMFRKQWPTDRGHFEDTVTKTDLLSAIIAAGPCRPKKAECPDVFSEKYYSRWTKGNIKIERMWLCFSPSLKKPYCETCWLLPRISRL